MKKRMILSIANVLLTGLLNAQVSDSVSLGSGYLNESYYSLQDGEVTNIANNTWDLAFDVSNFGASIRANRFTEVYLYPGIIADWELLDTFGITGWTRVYNSDESWDLGALNTFADPADPTDLGWGIYNTSTHIIEGSQLFVAKLQSGNYKKFFIETLGSGAYTLKSSFLDNTELLTTVITKASYADLNFIHYSLESNAIISREPSKHTWDIVFSNYHSEIAPDTHYGVTGVLSNKGVTVLEVEDVPTDEADFDALFSETINTIGHDWKAFNMESFAYDVTDSLTYFVFTNNEDVWKILFTGFSGSSNGKIYFTKELMSSAGITEFEQTEVLIFPNPSANYIQINTESEIDQIRIYNINGKVVYQSASLLSKMLMVDVMNYPNGNYIVETILLNNNKSIDQIVISK